MVGKELCRKGYSSSQNNRNNRTSRKVPWHWISSRCWEGLQPRKHHMRLPCIFSHPAADCGSRAAQSSTTVFLFNARSCLFPLWFINMVWTYMKLSAHQREVLQCKHVCGKFLFLLCYLSVSKVLGHLVLGQGKTHPHFWCSMSSFRLGYASSQKKGSYLPPNVGAPQSFTPLLGHFLTCCLILSY